MDRKNPSVPSSTQVSPARRLIAAGFTRRLAGRTLAVRVTEAGVTGRISKNERLAELHRACRADYEQAAETRASWAAQDHSDHADILARAAEAVTGR